MPERKAADTFAHSPNGWGGGEREHKCILSVLAILCIPLVVTHTHTLGASKDRVEQAEAGAMHKVATVSCSCDEWARVMEGGLGEGAHLRMLCPWPWSH